MAIVDRVVTEHGGTIRVENRDDGGARVVIALPYAAMPRDEDVA